MTSARTQITPIQDRPLPVDRERMAAGGSLRELKVGDPVCFTMHDGEVKVVYATEEMVRSRMGRKMLRRELRAAQVAEIARQEAAEALRMLADVSHGIECDEEGRPKFAPDGVPIYKYPAPQRVSAAESLLNRAYGRAASGILHQHVSSNSPARELSTEELRRLAEHAVRTIEGEITDPDDDDDPESG